jgi:hypothetical protein
MRKVQGMRGITLSIHNRGNSCAGLEEKKLGIT